MINKFHNQIYWRTVIYIVILVIFEADIFQKKLVAPLGVGYRNFILRMSHWKGILHLIFRPLGVNS